MADRDTPGKQTLPTLPRREFLRTLPVIGHFTTPRGWGEYEDNHGNTLSGKTLHCADEAAPRTLAASDAEQLHTQAMHAAVGASVASSLGLDPGEAVTMTSETMHNDPRLARLEATRSKRRLAIDMAAKVVGDMVSGQYDLGTLESPLHAACSVPPPSPSKTPHR